MKSLRILVQFICICTLVIRIGGISDFEAAFVFILEVNPHSSEIYDKEFSQLKSIANLRISGVERDFTNVLMTPIHRFVSQFITTKLPWIKFNTGVLVYVIGNLHSSSMLNLSWRLFAGVKSTSSKPINNVPPTIMNIARETYVIGWHPRVTKLKPYFSEDSNLAFFRFHNLGNSTLEISVIDLCSRNIKSWNSSWDNLSKRDLDANYTNQFGNCFGIKLELSLKYKRLVVTKSADYTKDNLISARERIDVDLAQILVSDEKTLNEIVQLRQGRIFTTLSSKLGKENYGFVVDEYSFNFLSCDGTKLVNPYTYYRDVFSTVTWVIFVVVLVLSSIFLVVICKLWKHDQCYYEMLMLILRFPLEQIHVPTYIMQHGCFIAFLVSFHIFCLLLTNSYRGKLSMHFTAQPRRLKILKLNDALMQGFKVLGHTDAYAMMTFRRDWENFVAKNKNANRQDILEMILDNYMRTSHFFLAVGNIYEAAINAETKKHYGRIIESLTHPYIDNINSTETVKDLLLKCSRTVLAARTEIVDEMFLDLQVKSLLPDLYRGQDESLKIFRVWLFINVRRDRTGLLYKRMMSLIHSGIYQHKTWKIGKWKKEMDISRIAEASEYYDFANDVKYFCIFYAYAFLIVICLIFAVVECSIFTFKKRLSRVVNVTLIIEVKEME